jgi:hypothetical protein
MLQLARKFEGPSTGAGNLYGFPVSSHSEQDMSTLFHDVITNRHGFGG